jgi:hypothetical protein
MHVCWAASSRCLSVLLLLLLSAVTGQYGPFNLTTATLSQPRARFAAVDAGAGVVMFAGGIVLDPTVMSNVVDIFNSTASGAQQWTTATLSVGRGYLAGATCLTPANATVVLIAGGILNNGVACSNVVDIWRSDTRLWSATTLSQARWQLSAASTGKTVRARVCV